MVTTPKKSLQALAYLSMLSSCWSGTFATEQADKTGSLASMPPVDIDLTLRPTAESVVKPHAPDLRRHSALISNGLDPNFEEHAGLRTDESSLRTLWNYVRTPPTAHRNGKASEIRKIDQFMTEE